MNAFNDITRHNLHQMLPAIELLIGKASFIALDTEFTGLGNNKLTKDANIATRYTALKEVAENYALVAFGVTLFILSRGVYKTYNFNFSLLSQKPFTVWYVLRLYRDALAQVA